MKAIGIRFTAAALAICIAGTAVAQVTPALVALTRMDLESWLDGLVPRALKDGDIAGAVIVVTQDGKVLLQKGYGYADVGLKKPVDPQRTLFRPGSLSKLFTATALMQLVEQGRVELDADVNRYLDFKIPDAFGKPVTLRNLLTHSAGFEDVIKGLVAYVPDEIEPLDVYVKAHVPRRVYPPGEVPAYSNYGMTLVGYVVQRVSGEPLEQYIRRHIFEPLDMRNSSFEQPLPQRLAADMAKGYAEASGPVVPFEIFGPAPAGAQSSTGADMAHAMIAYLQEGHYGDRQILKPETLRAMYVRADDGFASIVGQALGFVQYDLNGRRVVGHDGGTPGFRTNVRLFLDDNIGLFASFNGVGAEGAVFPLRAALLAGFAARYLPYEAPERAAINSAEDAQKVAGRYLPSPAPARFFGILNLDQIVVTANSDGTIVLSSQTHADGTPKIWRQVSPAVWQESGGRDRLQMRIRDGRIVAIGQSYEQAEILLPVPAWQSASWNVPSFIAMTIVLLATAVGWPILLLVRRHYGAVSSLDRSAMLATRLARITAVAAVIFLSGWVAVLLQVTSGHSEIFTSRLDPWLRLLHLVGLLAVIGTGFASWNALLTCRGRRGWAARLWSVAVATACLALVWFSFAFGLITTNLRY